MALVAFIENRIRHPRPECCHLKDLIPEMDVCQAKTAPDQATVAKDLLDLRRRGIGGDVEVLRLPAEEQVPDATTNEAGGKTVVPQAIKDSQGIGVDQLPGDVVFCTFDYYRLKFIHTDHFISHSLA